MADYPDIYATRDRPGLKSLWRSAVRSFVGELFLRKSPPDLGTARRLLNAGCGPRRFEGFVNADFYTTRGLLKPGKSEREPDWMFDARRPVKCADDYWDGIFCEHMIEHLLRGDARTALSEFFRTLKPGGRLRITVPDAGRFATYYVTGDAAAFASEPARAWTHRANALADVTQMWGHLSVWDENWMTAVLAEIGFASIDRCTFGEGNDSELLRDDPEKAWETLYMEAVKPGPGAGA